MQRGAAAEPIPADRYSLVVRKDVWDKRPARLSIHVQLPSSVKTPHAMSFTANANHQQVGDRSGMLTSAHTFFVMTIDIESANGQREMRVAFHSGQTPSYSEPVTSFVFPAGEKAEIDDLIKPDGYPGALFEFGKPVRIAAISALDGERELSIIVPSPVPDEAGDTSNK